MQHIIAYEGLVNVSLGLMQEEYIPTYLPWINRRIGIDGTLQRPPYSLASGIEWVRGLDAQKGKNEVFAILLHRGTGKRRSYQYIGHTGMHGINWQHGFATTGSIIDPDNGQGRGYGTEAKLLLQYHAFMVLGLRKLTSTVKVFNGGSLGHLLKCGYRIVGRHKKHHFHEGRFVDEVFLEVFRDEWWPIWERYQKRKTLPKLSKTERALVFQLVAS